MATSIQTLIYYKNKEKMVGGEWGGMNMMRLENIAKLQKLETSTQLKKTLGEPH